MTDPRNLRKYRKSGNSKISKSMKIIYVHMTEKQINVASRISVGQQRLSLSIWNPLLASHGFQKVPVLAHVED